MSERGYLNRLNGAVSRLLNVLVLNGHPAESISGRCWRKRLESPDNRWWWRLCRAIDLLFFWEEDHCRRAYTLDIEYAANRMARHSNLETAP